MAVKALACELPGEHGIPVSRLSTAEIRRAIVERGIVASIGETTVWRWLCWLGGGLEKTVEEASQLIGEKEPGSTLHRQVWTISPQKFRSQKREATLQQAMRCLVVEQLFTRLFGKKIFPDFATAHGWS